MVEGRLPGGGGGVDLDEFVAAGDGLAVPEAVFGADPGGWAGDVDGEVLVLGAESEGAFVIGASGLGVDDGGDEE